MSQEIVRSDAQNSALPAIFAGGINPFTTAAKNEGVTDGVFGRFNGNDGTFLLGTETVEAGTPVLVEFMAAKQSWLGFTPENRPVRGPEVSILSGAPLEEPDRTKEGVRWSKQIVVPMVTLEGQRVIFSAKAEKGTRPIWRLLNQYGQLLSRHVDANGRPKVPVVELHSRPFTIQVDEPIRNRDGSFEMDQRTGQPKTQKVSATKYAEEYKIVDWMTEAEVEDIVSNGATEEGDEDNMKVVNHVEEAQVVEIIPPTHAAGAPTAQPQAAVAPGQRRFRAGQRA